MPLLEDCWMQKARLSLNWKANNCSGCACVFWSGGAVDTRGIKALRVWEIELNSVSARATAAQRNEKRRGAPAAATPIISHTRHTWLSNSFLLSAAWLFLRATNTHSISGHNKMMRRVGREMGPRERRREEKKNSHTHTFNSTAPCVFFLCSNWIWPRARHKNRGSRTPPHRST